MILRGGCFGSTTCYGTLRYTLFTTQACPAPAPTMPPPPAVAQPPPPPVAQPPPPTLGAWQPCAQYSTAGTSASAKSATDPTCLIYLCPGATLQAGARAARNVACSPCHNTSLWSL